MMDKWLAVWMNYGCTEGRRKRRFEWRDMWKDELIGLGVDGQINEWVDEWGDGQMNCWMYRWVIVWMDGRNMWTDEWIG